jgi:hypothetical protein
MGTVLGPAQDPGVVQSSPRDLGPERSSSGIKKGCRFDPHPFAGENAEKCPYNYYINFGLPPRQLFRFYLWLFFMDLHGKVGEQGVDTILASATNGGEGREPN